MDSDGGRNPDYKPYNGYVFSSHAFYNINFVINKLLDKGGKFILTFPIGYCNKEIDYSLQRKEEKYFGAEMMKIYYIENICVMVITK